MPSDRKNPDDLRSAWDALVGDARALAEALTETGTQLARQLPGATMAAEQLRRVEDLMLREVRDRLDRVSPRNGTKPEADAARTAPGASPARLLEGLLDTSIEDDHPRSREHLYRRLLVQLVPDEARMLAALADGTVYPLVHVQTRAGGGARTVLADASTVGRAAGVQLPGAVPTYVANLRRLGLAEEGPEDETLSVSYDILLGEDHVRRAEEEARRDGRLGARVLRRTLRISELGRELWLACRPGDGPEQPC